MASGIMQGQKSVFRLQNYKARKALTEDSSERSYHARRPHRKSRAGCLNCKQRRVKCDETKPYCLKCQKHGVECDYTGEPKRPPNKQNIITRFIEHDPQLISVDRLASSMSLLLVAERMNDLLSLPAAKKPPKHPIDAPERLCGVAALQHFHNVTASTISATNAVTDTMLTQMTKLAFETPFLMHAIIAVATTHICRISPDNSGYRIAEAYHWQQAVTQYSKEVATSITQANMDKLYSACILLTVHSFTLKEYNPHDSFVFSDDPAALNWLFLQGGMRYLLERTNQWLPQSMWFENFMQVRDDASVDYEDSRPGRVDLDPDLADLCGITEASTVANNPYLWPLRMLMQFLPLERTSPNFRTYFNWAGRLEPEYLQCLLQKEPPAMILLAWWLALMCGTNVWWLDARVRSECTAICMRLEDSEDPLVLRLLEFPAEQCGYILRHVQEQACIELETDLTMA